MTSWLVLCAAGGHEREAARVVNRNDGAAYIPEWCDDGTWRPLLSGYVFATWLNEPPWHRLDAHSVMAFGEKIKLIHGYLALAGSEAPARVLQREIDLMEAHANETAKASGVPRHRVGDLKPQKVGLTGAEILWKVTAIAEGFATMQTVMLGKIIERKVREAA